MTGNRDQSILLVRCPDCGQEFRDRSSTLIPGHVRKGALQELCSGAGKDGIIIRR